MWKVLRFFARFYTPGKFVTFVRKTGRKVHFLPKLLTIFYCMQDEDTPKFIKLALMGALGYVILPFDFVPDVFAGCMVPVEIPALGDIDLSKNLLIEKCTHTWSNNDHTMDLEMKVHNG